ncbi:MAG: hypothetical protein CMO61_01940 [Verrucomicrobiales bacterium]|jgi:cardiolipin synthase|nr:hypothetical protein [Verrucomicrobiales bacterium]|tara:strand:+ start:8784 stop:9083 length:300 start_codon:yes stop_codon:yes gene_type:complete
MGACRVRTFPYGSGFQHQKVVVVDEEFATVGNSDLDYRSRRLSFEVSVVVLCKGFVAKVAAMLEVDSASSREIDSKNYIGRPWWFRFAIKVARLAGPLF